MDIYVLCGSHLLRCTDGTAPGPGCFVHAEDYAALEARVADLEEEMDHACRSKHLLISQRSQFLRERDEALARVADLEALLRAERSHRAQPALTRVDAQTALAPAAADPPP